MHAPAWRYLRTGPIEQLWHLLAAEDKAQWLSRLATASFYASQQKLYNNHLKSEEYKELLALCEGKLALAHGWVQGLRNTEDWIRERGVVVEESSSAATIVEPSHSSVHPIETAFPAPTPLTNFLSIDSNVEDDTLDYGDGPSIPSTPRHQPRNHIFPTNALLDLARGRELTMKNGKKIQEEECAKIVECLRGFVQKHVPLEELAQRIYSDFYASNNTKPKKLCQVLILALNEVTADNVGKIFEHPKAIEDEREAFKMVQRCRQELEMICVAHRTSATVKPDKRPRYVSWSELQKKVQIHVNDTVEELQKDDRTDGDQLRRAARLALYVLEGEGPRHREYKTLTAAAGNGKNVYDTEQGTVTLGDYEAIHQYGDYQIYITEKTRILLDKLVATTPKERYLLTNTDTPHNPESWSQLCSSDIDALSKHKDIQLHLNSSHLRFAFIDDHRSNLATVYAKAEIARGLGISLNDVFNYLEQKPERERKRKRGPRSSTSSSRGLSKRRYRTQSQEGSMVNDDTMSLESGEVIEG